MKENRVKLKTYFQDGDQPTEQEFVNWFDSSLILSGSNAITGSLIISGSQSDNLDNTPPNLHVMGDITASGNIVAFGDVIAKNYIVSSSITNITTQTMSGSTEFGDTANDTHKFIGNITASSDISASNTVSANTFSVANGGKIHFINPAGNTDDRIYLGDDKISIAPNDTDILTVSDLNPGLESNVVIEGDLNISSHITSSGNISASGTASANLLEAGTGSFTFISASNIVVGPEGGNTGQVITNNIQGMSPRSLLIQNAREMQAGGSGEPFLTVEGETNHDIKIGDAYEAENSTYIFVDDTNQRIEHSNDSIFNRDISVTRNITASGNISASGTIFATTVSASGTIFATNVTASKLYATNTIAAEDGLDIHAGNVDFNSGHDDNSITVYGGGTDHLSNIVFQLNTADGGHSAQLFTAPNLIDPAGSGKDAGFARFTVNGHISASGGVSTGPLTASSVNTIAMVTSGHITASGNISASGDVYGGNVHAVNTLRLHDASGTSRNVVSNGSDDLRVEVGNVNMTSGVSLIGKVTASGDISSSGTGIFNRLDVAEYIYHKDDNTYIRFLEDRIIMVASNSTVLNLNVGADSLEFGHTGKNATIQGSTITLTGNVTASGNISSSGTISSTGYNIKGSTALSMVLGGTNALNIGNSTDTTTIFGNTISTEDGSPFTVQGHLTASGNISSSGYLYGDNATIANTIYLGGENRIDHNNSDIRFIDTGLYVAGGHITASGNISASGGIIGDKLHSAELISGRVTFAGGGGRLSDDADLTFENETLTVTKIDTTNITASRDISASAIGTVSAGSGSFHVASLTALPTSPVNLPTGSIWVSGSSIQAEVNCGTLMIVI
tara:strand:- start:89 stop:2632 length:2544 start_codon:yes stop_codon:yes gene_type:complete